MGQEQTLKSHLPPGARPTPFSTEVANHERVCQSLMGSTSLVHRDWFFHAVKVMAQMDNEIWQLRLTVNRLDEEAGREPRYARP